MALTGQSLGGEFLIYVDGTAIGYCKSGTLNISAEMADATSKSSTANWAENNPTKKSWSVDFDALYVYDAAYGVSDLLTLLTAGTQVSLKFSPNESGNKYFTGDAYVDNITIDTPDQDNTGFSGSFTGDGALTEATLT